MRHIKFPSIQQFRQIIAEVRRWSKTRGFPDPVLKFKGTVKLHGTNVAICSTGALGDVRIWTQSREMITSINDTTYGFAAFVQGHEEYLRGLMEKIRVAENTTSNDTILIFGEWAGKGIHPRQSCAIHQFDKAMYIFRVSIVNRHEIFTTDQGQDIIPWRNLSDEKMDQLHNETLGFYSITKFPTYEIEIDFANPELSQNRLVELTNQVETRCPVAAQRGIDGVGEGIVWRAEDYTHKGVTIADLLFKVKGEKHSVTKVTALAAVDIEKVNSIKALVDALLTEERLEQGFAYLKTELGIKRTIENTSVFIKWVTTDIMKEEKDTIIANGFEPKEIMASASRNAAAWYKTKVT